MSNRQLWDKMISYGADNRCSPELAISCVAKTDEEAAALYRMLHEYRRTGREPKK